VFGQPVVLLGMVVDLRREPQEPATGPGDDRGLGGQLFGDSQAQGLGRLLVRRQPVRQRQQPHAHARAARPAGFEQVAGVETERRPDDPLPVGGQVGVVRPYRPDTERAQRGEPAGAARWPV
jgi:hypothetical protein